MYEHSSRKPNGHAIITDFDGNTKTLDTNQCCHCGCHFEVVKGSGKIRGFCTMCNKITCGKPECNAHFPFEKKLDLYEKGILKHL